MHTCYIGQYDSVVGGHEHDNVDKESLQRHLDNIDAEASALELLMKERGEKDVIDGRTALHVAAAKG